MILAIYVLYLVGGKESYRSLYTIQRTLGSCGIGDDKRNMQALMNKMIDVGWVLKDNGRYFYKITVLGINFMNQFELRLRKERWNR